MAVKVVGLNELIRDLRAVSKEYPKELKSIHGAVGDLVVPDARRRVKSRSGRLAASVRSSPTQKQARIRAGRAGLDPRTGYDYSRINYFGGYPGAYGGNPFIEDAVDANMNRILDVYMTKTERFLDRVIKGA